MSFYRSLVLFGSPNAFWTFDNPVHTASAPVLDASSHGRHGANVGATWENTALSAGLLPVTVGAGNLYRTPLSPVVY